MLVHLRLSQMGGEVGLLLSEGLSHGRGGNEWAVSPSSYPSSPWSILPDLINGVLEGLSHRDFGGRRGGLTLILAFE